MTDLISRQAAIDALDVGAEVLRRVLDEVDVVGVERAKYEWGLGLIESHIADVNDLPSAQPEQPPEIQDILNYLDTVLHPILSPERWDVYSELHDMISTLPSAQPEQRTCVNCGRTVNNGGWYADGRTRCPIEEHYALPKDGYCHLWEKRNVTDDDYPERRTDGRD